MNRNIKVIITGSNIKENRTVIDYSDRLDFNVYERVPSEEGLMGMCGTLFYIIDGELTDRELEIIKANIPVKITYRKPKN